MSLRDFVDVEDSKSDASAAAASTSDMDAFLSLEVFMVACCCVCCVCLETRESVCVFAVCESVFSLESDFWRRHKKEECAILRSRVLS